MNIFILFINLRILSPLHNFPFATNPQLVSPLSLTQGRMLSNRVWRWVGPSKMHRGMLFSPLAASRTHLMVVGVEAAHQLATVGLLLLLKLAEGQREEKKERVCAPAPHGRRVGPRCARGEGGGTTALQRTGLTGPNVLTTPLHSSYAWPRVYESNCDATVDAQSQATAQLDCL